MEILSRGNRTQDRDRNPFLVEYILAAQSVQSPFII